MAAEARKPKESGEEKAAQIRVLIAEDNMINMKVALGILRRMGYEQVCFFFCLLTAACICLHVSASTTVRHVSERNHSLLGRTRLSQQLHMPL